MSPRWAGRAPPGIAQLLLAADSFLIARPLPGQPNGKSVIAGYPWVRVTGGREHADLPAGPDLGRPAARKWGTRHPADLCAGSSIAACCPMCFPGAGDKPEYNTVDASLWFFEAWRAYSGGKRRIAKSLAQVFS